MIVMMDGHSDKQQRKLSEVFRNLQKRRMMRLMIYQNLVEAGVNQEETWTMNLWVMVKLQDLLSAAEKWRRTAAAAPRDQRGAHSVLWRSSSSRPRARPR